MKITVSQLRRIIKEEVSRSLKETTVGPKSKKSIADELAAMFGGDVKEYDDAAGIIADTLRGLDGEYSPVYDPTGEIESALSMTSAGDSPRGGTEEVMNKYFTGQIFDE